MTLAELVKGRLHARHWEVWGYLGSGFMAYLSPAVLFALSAYLISKASLRPGILTLGVAIGSVRFFALARGASQYGERSFGHSLTLDIAAKVRTALFDRLRTVVPYRVPPGLLGDLLGSLNGDLTQLENLTARLIGPAIGVALASITSLIIAALISLEFFAVLLPTLIIAGIIVPVTVGLLAKSRSSETSQLRARLYDESLSVAATFESRYFLTGKDSLLARLHSKASDLLSRAEHRAVVQAGLGIANAIVEASALAATLWIGADLIASRSIQGVEVAVIPFLLLAILEGLGTVGLEAAEAGAGTPSLRQIERALTLKGRDTSHCTAKLATATPLSINCHHVSFSYPDSHKTIISSLSLYIDQGTRLLVVGPTGSGKSTLAALILGAWIPTEGTVELDNVPTTELSEETIAATIGYLPSNAYLFGSSLASNMRLAKSDASDTEITSVLTQVRMGDWFASLPEGLNTKVGKGYQSVSRGEGQRLALAQLLLLAPKTLVLDEPTAGLDAQNEQMVLEVLNAQFRDATVVAISHSEAFMEAFETDQTLNLGT